MLQFRPFCEVAAQEVIAALLEAVVQQREVVLGISASGGIITVVIAGQDLLDAFAGGDLRPRQQVPVLPFELIEEDGSLQSQRSFEGDRFQDVVRFLPIAAGIEAIEIRPVVRLS